MRKLEVGQLFEAGKTQFNEGCKFDFQPSGGILFLFYKSPTDKEIEDIKSGTLKLGIYAKDEVIFMLYKFGSQEWIDVPYSVHLSEKFELMELAPGMGYNTTIYLIDAATGILKVMRFIGMPHKMSIIFRQEVEKQRLQLFNVTAYNQKINLIYDSYITNDLVDRTETFKLKEE